MPRHHSYCCKSHDGSIPFEFKNSNMNLNRFELTREISDSNRGDVASLAEFTVAWLSGRHNSPPLQEISSRDLSGGVRGEGVGSEKKTNESSWSWLLFSKWSIHYIDVFICLLQVILMKSSSFLQDLHRTYGNLRGKNSGRTELNIC